MTGRLIGVVGPSGVGKDTVMEALAAAEPGLGIIRRVITRAPLGGEDHISVTEAEFEARRAAGAFCIHWRAHGLLYGIPADVRQRIEAGERLLVNLSRQALPATVEVFPDLLVLSLTAKPETLARRLAGRGRETAAEIERRLARAELTLPPGIRHVTISNDGALAETVAAARAALQPERA